jgi:Uri superfamily endonuclease
MKRKALEQSSSSKKKKKWHVDDLRNRAAQQQLAELPCASRMTHAPPDEAKAVPQNASIIPMLQQQCQWPTVYAWCRT